MFKIFLKSVLMYLWILVLARHSRHSTAKHVGPTIPDSIDKNHQNRIFQWIFWNEYLKLKLLNNIYCYLKKCCYGFNAALKVSWELSVSDPYSSNPDPDPDPAKNLNPDPDRELPEVKKIIF